MRYVFLFTFSLLLFSCSAQVEEAAESTAMAGDKAVDDYAGYDDYVGAGSEYATASVEEGVPIFPLPAPNASTSTSLPALLFGNPERLGDISDPLITSLETAGYENFGFYRVVDGFALVTETERIHNDGRPFEGEERWIFAADSLVTVDDIFDEFPFGFLSKLRNADPGRYRVILFLVTTVPVTESNEDTTFEHAESWTDEGADFLPPQILARPFTENHNISVLVYEFQRASVGAQPEFLGNGTIRARTHLSETGLLGGSQ